MLQITVTSTSFNDRVNWTQKFRLAMLCKTHIF